MDHIITADDSEEITIHSKWLDWTWTLGQLFQQSENGHHGNRQAMDQDLRQIRR
jgi:hypothetical protein